MDEQIPSLNPLFDIQNIPFSAPISPQIIFQINSNNTLNMATPLCSSSASLCDHNEPLGSTIVSMKAENIGRHEVAEISESKSNKANKPSSARKKKSTPPRIAFHTRSDDDVLDDGFRWRKYGQKSVKNSNHPRSYYRCSHHTCSVKKQIQRFSKDSSIVVTTYEGVHNHPCESLMESLNPLLKQLQFLTRI